MRILLLLCLLSSATLAQPLTDTQKLASLARVWGFLKYHHPAVATGKRDWDEQLIRLIPAVQQAPDRQALSIVYGQLLDELGAVKPCRRCEAAPAGQRNLDLVWLTDSLLFTPDLHRRLTYLLDNRHQGSNQYVRVNLWQGIAQFDNEKLYPEQSQPTEAYRLLALFRYWNIINYFYPYKYAVDGNWNDVITDLIPVFRAAHTAEMYQQALYQMGARINDSHGFMQSLDKSRCMRCELGTFWLPFSVKLMDQQAVITRHVHDSLPVPAWLKVGTVIRAIDGESIQARIARIGPRIAASNDGALLRDLRWFIGNGPTNEARLTIVYNGQDTTVVVPRYPFRSLNRSVNASPNDQKLLSQWLPDSVGYVNMGKLEPRRVDSVMRSLETAKALIFDLRNYPKGTYWLISRYLTDERPTFIRFTRPDPRFPGTFIQNKSTKLPRTKKKKMDGKVVYVLIDEETQSHAEFTAMAFRAVPGVTLVGSPTAGADGNITWVPLPGNYRTAFSGIGVYYPDGRETQRVGIVPDVLVRPTPEGIRDGRDEVLERALQLARTVR